MFWQYARLFRGSIFCQVATRLGLHDGLVASAEARSVQGTRLLLADDNQAVLDSVVRILQTDFIITGAFTNGKSVLEKVVWLNPDVIILDISMSDISGLDVARCLKDMRCQAKLIFLSVHDDIDFVQAAFTLGAAGYVLKSALSGDLVAAIAAASHDMLFYPKILLDSRSLATNP